MSVNPKISFSLKDLCQVTITALLIALLPLPYLYYIALRMLVFATSLLLLLNRMNLHSFSKIALVIFAILYNPVFALHTSKIFWVIVNILTVAMLYSISQTLNRDC